MSEAWDCMGGTRREWRSGRWSLELRDDELADIAFDGRVVLRAVRAVIRDRDWNTAALVVDRVDASGLAITLHVRSEGLESDFRGIVRAETRSDGIRFIMDLESAVDFGTNRIGLVVLHPPVLAGRELTVRHPDGATAGSAFPVAISPHQPVFDIAGLAWNDGDLDVRVAFEGEVFEMEDQRNWTDASFKTYSRPLSLPVPYRVAAGERVRQTVSLWAEPNGRSPEPRRGDAVLLRAGGAFPQIAIGASTAPDPAPGFAPVGSVLLVELDLSTPNWRAALQRATASGLPLDVRFVVDGPAGDPCGDPPVPLEAVTALADAAAELRAVTVVRVAAFARAPHTPDALVPAAREAFGWMGVPVLGGVRSHFTQLNRAHHLVPPEVDGIVFATTPLFHALGTAQLIESVAMQRLVSLQAVEIAGDVPVHVGPVTLRPRFTDVTADPQPSPSSADLREGYGAALTGAADPRQCAPELAAWTVASAAALAVPGVASLAYFEEWGPRGIRSADGEPYPVVDALAALAALEGGELLSGASADGLVWAVGSTDDAGTTVLVANLSPTPRSLSLDVAGTPAAASVAPLSWTTLRL